MLRATSAGTITVNIALVVVVSYVQTDGVVRGYGANQPASATANYSTATLAQINAATTPGVGTVPGDYTDIAGV